MRQQYTPAIETASSRSASRPTRLMNRATQTTTLARFVGGAGEVRASASDVAAAAPLARWAHPERENRSARQEEAQLDDPIAERSDVVRRLPPNELPCAVGSDRNGRVARVLF